MVKNLRLRFWFLDSSYVALDKSLNFSEAQWPHLQNKYLKNLFHQIVMKINRVRYIKTLDKMCSIIQ